jgi:hypothetical protein
MFIAPDGTDHLSSDRSGMDVFRPYGALGN